MEVAGANPSRTLADAAVAAAAATCRIFRAAFIDIKIYTSSKGEKTDEFPHPSVRTMYVRPSSLAIASRKLINSLSLSTDIVSQFLCQVL